MGMAVTVVRGLAGGSPRTRGPDPRGRPRGRHTACGSREKQQTGRVGADAGHRRQGEGSPSGPCLPPRLTLPVLPAAASWAPGSESGVGASWVRRRRLSPGRGPPPRQPDRNLVIPRPGELGSPDAGILLFLGAPISISY